MFANKGTGKTTYFAKRIKADLKNKKVTAVFCNVPIYGALKFDVKEYLGRRDLPRGSKVYIDEGAIELPNTVNLTKQQALYFILSRHAEVDFYIISQSWEDLNIKIRRLYDKVWFLKRHWLISDITVLHRYRKELEVDEETHQFVDGYYKTFPWPIINRKMVYRPNYYRFFDSYDMPSVGPQVPMETWEVELPPTFISKVMYLVDNLYKKMTKKEVITNENDDDLRNVS